MKHIIFFSVAAVAAATLISTGCAGEDKEGNPDILLESYTFDTVARNLSADSIETTGWQYCRFSGTGVLPRDVNNHNIRILRDSLLSMAMVRYSDSGDIIPDTDSTFVMMENSSALDACSSSHSRLTVSMVTPKAIVWDCYTESYECMAAHGLYGTTYLNYDIVSNKILELADLFKPGYEDTLTDIVAQEIREKYGDRLFDTSEDIPLPPGFALTTSGIRFTYPVYSIAPYSSGEISVLIPTYQLEDLLSPRGENILKL